jgi:polyphosphate glucokinase
MKILAIDVGGTHVKVLLSGESTPRKFVSGPNMTAKKMVAGVKESTTSSRLAILLPSCTIGRFWSHTTWPTAG